MKTPVVKGKKGGTIVYTETFGRRHFTPTHFIDMVGRGWIGTSALQTDVLAPYLRAALQGDKGLVLAVQSSNSGHPAADEESEEGRDPPLRTIAPPKPRYPGKKPKVIQI